MRKVRAGTDKAELWVEWVALPEVAGWPRNPKKHDVAGIRASLRRHGMVELAARDERTGRLVAGHGRLEALQGMRADGEKPPARVRVLPGGEWAMPVLRGASFPSDEAAESYLLASNHLTELAGWDTPGLSAILGDLQKSDEALLATTGFTDKDIARIIDVGPHTRMLQSQDLCYQIVVQCDDEQHQAELLEKLEAGGLHCKPLIS